MNPGNFQVPDPVPNQPTAPLPSINQVSPTSRQVIESALGGFYNPAAIMARDIHDTRPGVYTVTCVFPRYERTVGTLGHVSGVQMQAALFESLYCAVAQAIMQGAFPATMSLESFRDMRSNYFMTTQNLSYRKMLKEGDAGEFRVKIDSFDETSGKIIFDVSGILKGQIACLRRAPDDLNETTESWPDPLSAASGAIKTSRQIIDSALGGFYRPESVMARHVQPLGENQVEVTSMFPTYERTGCAMGHVSGVQIHAAVLESLYCAVAYSLSEETFPAELTMESFRTMRADFLLYGVKLPVRKRLRTGESAALKVKIRSVDPIRIVKPFHKVTFDLTGTVCGSVDCLLEVPVQ